MAIDLINKRVTCDRCGAYNENIDIKRGKCWKCHEEIKDVIEETKDETVKPTGNRSSLVVAFTWICTVILLIFTLISYSIYQSNYVTSDWGTTTFEMLDEGVQSMLKKEAGSNWMKQNAYLILLNIFFIVGSIFLTIYKRKPVTPSPEIIFSAKKEGEIGDKEEDKAENNRRDDKSVKSDQNEVDAKRRLNTLQELLDENIITEEEYNKKRDEILGSI